MLHRSSRKAHENKAVAEAALGGVCGLGLAIILAIALAVLWQGDARGQQLSSDRPALESARFECESGARDSVLTGRALGACDVLLRAPEIEGELRARALTNRAVILLARGDASDARSDLEEAVRLAPELSAAWLNLSAARIRTGSAALALEASDQAGALGADPALVAFNAGIALETLGRFEDAYNAYREAARLAPANTLLQAQPARFTWHQPGS